MTFRLWLSLLGILLLASPLSAHGEDRWEVIEPVLERSSLNHVEILPEGDILVAGHASTTSRFFAGIWIARYTPVGQQVWSKEFVGQAHSRTTALIVEEDRILIVGTHHVPNPFQGDATGFIAALDFDGNLRWETSIEEQGENIRILRVEALENGDLMLAGSISEVDGSIQSGPFFSRLSPSGEIRWSFYEPPRDDYYADLPPPRAGVLDKIGNPVLWESAGPVKEQDDGTLHLHVFRQDIIPGSPEPARCIVVSDDGLLLDRKSCQRIRNFRAGSDQAPKNVRLEKVSPGMIMVSRVEVSKLDDDGDIEWTWQLRSDHKAGLTDAVSTADGGLIGVGYTIIPSEKRMHGYDAIIFRLDASGNELWSHTYRSAYRDIFAGIAALDEDSFIVVGHTGASMKARWWEPWILRIGGDGLVESETEILTDSDG